MKKLKYDEKQKKIIKPEKKRKKKPHEKKKNLATAALTGWPNFAPARAERSSAPLTGGT
jgi:hypothetical protein